MREKKQKKEKQGLSVRLLSIILLFPFLFELRASLGIFSTHSEARFWVVK